MMDTMKTDSKMLYALIDELIIYIDMLKKSPYDRPMVDLFQKRFFRFELLLSVYGYIDLSNLVGNFQNVFSRVFNRSIYVTQETLQIAISLLVLARKALMFTDTPDFKEIADAMMIELQKSLRQLSESIPPDKAATQNNSGYRPNKKNNIILHER